MVIYRVHWVLSSSTWIRTRTNRTKNCCATVTPSNYKWAAKVIIKFEMSKIF